MEEDSDGDLAGFEALNYDDLDSVSKLQKTQRHIDIMQVLGKALWKQWCCLWTNFKFVFHTCAGIELTNPQAHVHQLGSGTQSTSLRLEHFQRSRGHERKHLLTATSLDDIGLMKSM
ncbi:uncharacterized protein LOC111317416 isoform X3 [Durio zibethinus]|nr:uncharacterized protein LOC111317416 isoform X3 [Durio zibethinus]